MSITRLSRKELLRALQNRGDKGVKNLNDTLGYPEVILAQDYVDMYERGGIAARVCDAYPDATWRSLPDIVFVDEKGKTVDRKKQEDAINKAFWNIFSDKRGFISILARFDRLIQLGSYGILHIGVDDEAPLDEPIQARSNLSVLYLQPYSEASAEVVRWEEDPKSVRYGKPVLYRIKERLDKQSNRSRAFKSREIHFSRVIHAAEHTLEDESIGLPRLERVWNYILDLQKVTGSSAETFWQNAALFIAFVAGSDVEWEPEEKADLKQQLDDMSSGLQRYLRLRGVEPQNLASPVADPKEHFQMLVSLIGGAWSIPKRILIGSEMGQLASEQDGDNWNARVLERREQYAGPCIVAPLVSWLQQYKFIPEGNFDVVWETEDGLSAEKRADIAEKRTRALVAYADSIGADALLPPEEFLKWLEVNDSVIEALEDVAETPFDELDPEVAGLFSKLVSNRSKGALETDRALERPFNTDASTDADDIVYYSGDNLYTSTDLDFFEPTKKK